mmetsp:Transcript_22732/g.69184  ORF Transcript_22732/g.69184 Transcript_22732/m.69184 type:complete len:493 (-) Transcript_22732:149-1627(-)
MDARHAKRDGGSSRAPARCWEGGEGHLVVELVKGGRRRVLLGHEARRLARRLPDRLLLRLLGLELLLGDPLVPHGALRTKLVSRGAVDVGRKGAHVRRDAAVQLLQVFDQVLLLVEHGAARRDDELHAGGLAALGRLLERRPHLDRPLVGPVEGRLVVDEEEPHRRRDGAQLRPRESGRPIGQEEVRVHLEAAARLLVRRVDVLAPVGEGDGEVLCVALQAELLRQQSSERLLPAEVARLVRREAEPRGRHVGVVVPEHEARHAAGVARRVSDGDGPAHPLAAQHPRPREGAAPVAPVEGEPHRQLVQVLHQRVDAVLVPRRAAGVSVPSQVEREDAEGVSQRLRHVIPDVARVTDVVEQHDRRRLLAAPLEVLEDDPAWQQHRPLLAAAAGPVVVPPHLAVELHRPQVVGKRDVHHRVEPHETLVELVAVGAAVLDAVLVGRLGRLDLRHQRVGGAVLVVEEVVALRWQIRLVGRSRLLPAADAASGSARV